MLCEEPCLQYGLDHIVNAQVKGDHMEMGVSKGMGDHQTKIC